jgi:hypothetical protein
MGERGSAKGDITPSFFETEQSRKFVEQGDITRWHPFPSMGQQNRTVDRVIEHVTRRSAQDDLAEAAVTVTAHHQ